MPRTNAWVLVTDTPSSAAMKLRKRAESSTPAIPMTRSGGKPDAWSATWHIASRGLVTTMMMASGDAAAARDTTARTIPAFLARRSSRLMPGWRARPEVTTMTSEPAVSA
jgi:hypothetical protein